MAEHETSVLIVDDDSTFVDTWVNALKSAGYRVDGQSDPCKVASQVRRTQYAVVLLDVLMDRKSGFEVLLEIQTYSPGSRVIIFSGGTSREQLVQCLKHGACDYIPKPGNLDVLVEKIDIVVHHPELVMGSVALRENLIQALWKNVRLDESPRNGESLQMLLKHLFDSVPGFRAVTPVIQKHEEIDVVVENKRRDTLWFNLKGMILVECKNWTQQRPEPTDFNHFYAKLANRSPSMCSMGFFASYSDFTAGFLDAVRQKRASVPFVVPIGLSSLESLVLAGDGRNRLDLLANLVQNVGNA